MFKSLLTAGLIGFVSAVNLKEKATDAELSEMGAVITLDNLAEREEEEDEEAPAEKVEGDLHAEGDEDAEELEGDEGEEKEEGEATAEREPPAEGEEGDEDAEKEGGEAPEELE